MCSYIILTATFWRTYYSLLRDVERERSKATHSLGCSWSGPHSGLAASTSGALLLGPCRFGVGYSSHRSVVFGEESRQTLSNSSANVRWKSRHELSTKFIYFKWKTYLRSRPKGQQFNSHLHLGQRSNVTPFSLSVQEAPDLSLLHA